MEEKISNSDISKLLDELKEMKRTLAELQPPNGISNEWLTRTEVKTFLQYGSTQMASLERSGLLVVAKVGKRKFFHRQSFLDFLQKNIQK